MPQPIIKMVSIFHLMIIGITIIAIIGLLNNNFFPKKVPTEIVLTKSPLQITYKGNTKVDVVGLVNEAKDFPFVEYKFNPSLNVKIETSDSQNADTSIKTETTESISNVSNIENISNTKNTENVSKDQNDSKR